MAALDFSGGVLTFRSGRLTNSTVIRRNSESQALCRAARRRWMAAGMYPNRDGFMAGVISIGANSDGMLRVSSESRR